MTIPGVLAGATRRQPLDRRTHGPWRNLMRRIPDPAIRTPRTLRNQNLAEPGGTLRNPVEPRTIRPMIPLGQFRDTFIIAVDDEGIAIIDQHVAHERVLFEQVMERLTAGPLESQRLLTPMLIELSPAQRQALMPHAADARAVRHRDRGVRRRQRAAVGACRRCWIRRQCEAAVRALAEDLEGLDGGSRRRGRAAPDRRDDGVPRGREGELSADAGEDALHPRGAAPHGVFERLPARPPGRAAASRGARSRRTSSGSDGLVSRLSLRSQVSGLRSGLWSLVSGLWSLVGLRSLDQTRQDRRPSPEPRAARVPSPESRAPESSQSCQPDASFGVRKADARSHLSQPHPESPVRSFKSSGACALPGWGRRPLVRALRRKPVTRRARVSTPVQEWYA